MGTSLFAVSISSGMLGGNLVWIVLVVVRIFALQDQLNSFDWLTQSVWNWAQISVMAQVCSLRITPDRPKVSEIPRSDVAMEPESEDDP